MSKSRKDQLTEIQAQLERLMGQEENKEEPNDDYLGALEDAINTIDDVITALEQSP